MATAAFDGNVNKTGVAVMREFENIGAKVEARSDREKITYTIKVPSNELNRALELSIANLKSPIHREYVSIINFDFKTIDDFFIIVIVGD